MKKLLIYVSAALLICCLFVVSAGAAGPLRVGSGGQSQSRLPYLEYMDPTGDFHVLNDRYSGVGSLYGIYVAWDYADGKYNLTLWLEAPAVVEYAVSESGETSMYSGYVSLDYRDLSSLSLSGTSTYYLASAGSSWDVSSGRSGDYTYITFYVFDCDSGLINEFINNSIKRVTNVVLSDYPLAPVPKPAVPVVTDPAWDGVVNPTPDTSIPDNDFDDYVESRVDDVGADVSDILTVTPWIKYRTALTACGTFLTKLLDGVPLFSDLSKFWASFAVFNMLLGGFVVGVRTLTNDRRAESRAANRQAQRDLETSRRKQLAEDDEVNREWGIY